MPRQAKQMMVYEQEMLELIKDRLLHKFAEFSHIMVKHGRNKAQAGPVTGKLMKHGELKCYARGLYGVPGLPTDTPIAVMPHEYQPLMETKPCPHCQGTGRVALDLVEPKDGFLGAFVPDLDAED